MTDTKGDIPPARSQASHRLEHKEGTVASVSDGGSQTRIRAKVLRPGQGMLDKGSMQGYLGRPESDSQR